MVKGASTIPTDVEGIVYDGQVSSNTNVYNPTIVSGRQLNYAGVTTLTSAGKATNQAIDFFRIPAATPSGTTLAPWTNSLIGALSVVEVLELLNDPGVILQLAMVAQAPGSVTFMTRSSGDTVGAVDVAVRITN